MIIQTKDRDVIAEVMRDPQVWDALTDDGNADGEHAISDAVIYLECRSDKLDGIFVLVPGNSTTVEIHTLMLPHCRGKQALAYAREVQEWVWSNTGYHRLNTAIPEYNKAAIGLARMASMVKYGECPYSILKNGKFYSIHMMGMNRRDHDGRNR